ncbi:hypothetical protein FBU30_004225 [Linnemannia zychae]|nr:hypothetical protein FBU30_004225 [Linnemannia zychae]
MQAYPATATTATSTILDPLSISEMSKTAYNYRRRSEDNMVADEPSAIPDLVDENGDNQEDDDEDEVADEPMEDQSVPSLIVVQSLAPGSPSNITGSSYDIHPAT